MTLNDLLSAAGAQAQIDLARSGAGERAEATVTSVAYDSRAVTAGAVFVALRGRQADGVSFARDALRRGAVAIVAETPAPEATPAPWFVVPDARLALAALAHEFHGRPSESLALVGITGTNGKTTTSYLLASIFEAAGRRCGRIGTIGYRIGDREVDAPRTTPEAPDVQRMLREMVDEGCAACVMEVSSHALALRRADCLQFAAGVFTNLTRDHLDFHGNMEEYSAAKRRLFALLPAGAPGIVNLDDHRGQEFVKAAGRPVTYAIDAPADVRAERIAFSLDGLEFTATTPAGPVRVSSRLVGRPNAYNILASVTTAVALGLPREAIESGVRDVEDVPGRFQLVSSPEDDVRVVVDYAHTDDALKNLLETARPLAAARVITVFGCGGDRDKTKRPLMGAVAARLSDIVIVTSDNPRSENPEQIIEDIKRGIVLPPDRIGPKGQGPRSTPYLAIVDRKVAIERAVRDARPGDLVLVAGKGHEKYQVIGTRTLPFDDVEVARAALAQRRRGAKVSQS